MLRYSKRMGWAGVSFGIVEVVKADADEAETLRRAEGDALAERERDSGELFTRRYRLGRGKTAGEDLKLGRLEFENHGARNTRLFARGIPDLLREAADGVFGVFEGQVALEGVFRGDGFGGAVGHDLAVVHAKGELVEAMTVASEVILDGCQLHAAQIADGVDAEDARVFPR